MSDKKITLFLYLSLLCVSLNAQLQYKSCLDGEMTRWSFIDQHVCDAPLQSTEIIAYGDILFNAVMYKKLYLDSSSFYFDPFGNDAEESNTNWKNHVPQVSYEWENFFIRESEDASKLYIYNPRMGREYLISDMSLQEEEIFQFFTDDFGTHEAIVDSVYCENGLKHVAFFSMEQSLTFIESVGPDRWLIYPDGCGRGCFGLNCFQNQMTFYKNDRIMDVWNFADFPCGYHGKPLKINSIPENNYHVFIQKDKIEILFASNANVDISVYDMNGRSCYTKNDVLCQKFIIPITFFPKGVYILKIFNTENNQMNSTKVIIQ